MSSCDAWLQFVTPSDVRALKNRLDPFVTALDSAVAQCPKVDDATRSAWSAFVASWRSYCAAEDHFLTAGAEFNTGCEYQQTIAGWQRAIGALACGVPGPTLPEQRGAGGGDTATTSTVRTVAIAAGVIAVALTLRSFAR